MTVTVLWDMFPLLVTAPTPLPNLGQLGRLKNSFPPLPLVRNGDYGRTATLETWSHLRMELLRTNEGPPTTPMPNFVLTTGVRARSSRSRPTNNGRAIVPPNNLTRTGPRPSMLKRCIPFVPRSLLKVLVILLGLINALGWRSSKVLMQLARSCPRSFLIDVTTRLPEKLNTIFGMTLYPARSTMSLSVTLSLPKVPLKTLLEAFSLQTLVRLKQLTLPLIVAWTIIAVLLRAKVPTCTTLSETLDVNSFEPLTPTPPNRYINPSTGTTRKCPNKTSTVPPTRPRATKCSKKTSF